MIPWQLGMQGNAAMYSNARVWMQTFDCCCTNVQSLAFVLSPIAQSAQVEQGINSAPAWSEATLLVKKVVCQPL